MAKEKKEKKSISNYRISVFDDDTLQEIRTLKLNKFSMISYIGGLVVILTILITLVLIYTPLNILIPAKANTEHNKQIVANAFAIDSLRIQIAAQEHYVLTVKSILQGKIPNDTLTSTNTAKDSLSAAYQYDFDKSDLDSILRKQIEASETENLSVIEKNSGKVNLKNLHFTVPLRGILTGKFDLRKKHYAVDIVPERDDAAIVAVLPGTVISDSWSIQTGHVIQIQHDYNLVSIYKHNSVLLKKTGDRVRAGESIAIVGNSGEETTGPHLHFELWHNGEPVNPQNYIAF